MSCGMCRWKVARNSPTPYFSLLRIVFGARSEAHAIQTGEHFASRVEEFLEEGDSVEVLQTSQFGQYETPVQEIHILRQARNILLRLPHTDTHATAQMLDKFAWYLETGQTELDVNNYDFNRVSRIADEVLKGGNPLD